MEYIYSNYGDRGAAERLLKHGAIVVPRRDWNEYGNPSRAMLQGGTYSLTNSVEMNRVLLAHINTSHRLGDAVVVAYIGYPSANLKLGLSVGETLAIDSDGRVRMLQRVIFEKQKKRLNQDYSLDDLGACHVCVVPIEHVSAWDGDDQKGTET